MLTYFQNGDTLMITLDGKQHPVSRKSHPLFSQIVEAIENSDLEYLRENLGVQKAVVSKLEGRVEFDGENVWLNMPNLDVRVALGQGITDRIRRLAADGMPFGAVMKFLDNLIDNPSETSVEELLEFLECNELPFTPDGHFIAYKRVRSDFKDSYTGTIDNSVGQVVTMERESVDSERSRTCSSGLHFCSMGYLTGSGYGGEGNPIVLLKINPRDVVSIPTDYNNTKGRCCRYEVIGLHRSNSSEDDYVSKTPVYTDDYGDEEVVSKVFALPMKNYFFTTANKCKDKKIVWAKFTGFESSNDIIDWLFELDGSMDLDGCVRNARIPVGQETRLILRRSETNVTELLTNRLADITDKDLSGLESTTPYWIVVNKDENNTIEISITTDNTNFTVLS